MDLALFFQCLVNGLAIGGIYAVVASGSTLVFGAMKILSFARGQFYALGAFVVYDFFEVAHLRYAVGASIILIEQNARMALEIADYAYVIELGRIPLQGTGKDLANDPKVQITFLGG